LEYREPFVGGGSVFIALKQRYPDAVYKIGDLNYDLICFWNQLKYNSEELIEKIYYIKKTENDGRKLYDSLTNINEKLTEFDRAVRFFVLNRITYSGTVDSGGYSSQAFRKRFTIANIEKLKPLSNLLEDVMIINDSYEKLLLEDGENVFLYLDPPYLTYKKSKLYGTKGDLHLFFDHIKFAKDVKLCKHRWLITYDDSDDIRKLHKSTNIHPQLIQYVMDNAHNNKPKKGKEVYITNFLHFKLIPVNKKIIKEHSSKYEVIINKFIESNFKVTNVKLYDKKPYYVQQQLKRRITKKNLSNKILSYVKNKNLYLELI